MFVFRCSRFVIQKKYIESLTPKPKTQHRNMNFEHQKLKLWQK